MKVSDICKALDAEFLCLGEKADQIDIKSACGSDMMSDVLAYVKDQGMLLTGLTNAQVVRTAEMMDIICICFVRGKRPDESVIALAKEKGIILLTTNSRMYLACGLLYSKGLDAGSEIA